MEIMETRIQSDKILENLKENKPSEKNIYQYMDLEFEKKNKTNM